MVIVVLSAAFAMSQANVRVNAGIAVFVPVSPRASGILPKFRPEAEPVPSFGTVTVYILFASVTPTPPLVLD